MKKIKTLAAAFAVAFFASALFAQTEQNASSKSHLQKAKECISQRKWVSALGECYDSVLSDSAEDTEEAYKSWTEISEAIKNGKPGLGEFDDFSIVDNWILVLQDYERYWTNNCPFTIFFDKPERTELNREKRTADYQMKIRSMSHKKFESNRERYSDGTIYFSFSQFTPKFQEIDFVIQTGFKKAYKDDWKMGYLKYWPMTSVYNDKKYSEKYFIDGTALISIPMVLEKGYTYNKYISCGGKEFASKTSGSPLADKFYIDYSFKKIASFPYYIPIWEYHKLQNTKSIFKSSAYDYKVCGQGSAVCIKFSIIDKSGNKLLSSDEIEFVDENREIDWWPNEWDDWREWERTTEFVFKNVPQETMELIESDEVKIVVDEVYLKYGKLENLVVKGDTPYLKKLSKYKVENFSSHAWNEADVAPKTLPEIAEERKKEAEQKEAAKQRFIAALKDYDSELSRYINNALSNVIEIKGDKKNPLSFKIIEYQEPSIHPDLLEKYPEESIWQTFFYLFCNGINNRKCYFVDDSSVSESSYKNEAEFFLENFDKIKESPSNDDWRLPTKEEIEYVSSLRLKANKKSKLATISIEAILNGKFLIKKD